jgi:excisionase family DNA binding protein
VSATSLRQETYLPEDDGAELAEVYNFIHAHEAPGKGTITPRYFLAGAEAGDQVEIPAEVHRVLRQVVEALRQGLAVTVAPQSLTLTTQQAADLLGVSRPTLIKLLDEDRIAYERVGTHRRVLLRDLLAYRQTRREAQYAALEATAVDFEDEEDVESALVSLREARRAVAERRRAGSTL